MRHLCRSLVLVLPVVLGVGCTASSSYMRRGGASLAPRRDMARVVFIRPSEWPPPNAPTLVDNHGHFIGDCMPQSRFEVSLPPGEYTFIAWSEGTNSLQANLAAGKTYYIEVGAVPGVWSARFYMRAIKPSARNWPNLQKWMSETTPYEVLRDQGQEYVGGRKDSVDELIKKGIARFQGYDATEQQEASLHPEDGT